MKQAVRAIIINGDKMLAMHRNKFGHEYYTLVGGGVSPGEQLEKALFRELAEETGLRIKPAPRLVFTEEAGEPYGTQYVFLCEYIGGDPVLSPDSDEAKINRLGKNLYTPLWLPLDKLRDVPFRSDKLRAALLHSLQNGFPASPQIV